MKRRIILHVLFSLALVATILGRAPQATGAQTVASGTVQAWGDNGSGQLGNGTMTRTECACIPTPVSVSGLSGVTALASGDYHSLALLSDGTIRAWGDNAQGQLGDGTMVASATPVSVSGLSGVTAIAAGGLHSLALLRDGTVRAWGSNFSGQLGDGIGSDSATPVPVSVLSGVTALAGGYYHSLALLSDGTMRAWGYNYYGQLGTGTAPTGGCACIHTPVPVINLSGVTAIAAGGVHSLALLGDGTIRSWGENSQGQLGVGTTTNSATPVPVSGLGGVTAIAGTTSAWRSWATAPSVTGASTATASWAPVRRAPISERRYRSPV